MIANKPTNPSQNIIIVKMFYREILWELQITRFTHTNKVMEKKMKSFLSQCGHVREHRPRCLEKRHDWLAYCQRGLSATVKDQQSLSWHHPLLLAHAPVIRPASSVMGLHRWNTISPGGTNTSCHVWEVSLPKVWKNDLLSLHSAF